MSRAAVALVHHPCLDKQGKVYTTSLTNLDVHDIARSSRTFGVAAYYIVTPIRAQQELARTIASFWEEGRGKARNPDRTEALRTVRVVSSIEDAIEAEARELGTAPLIVVTSARDVEESVSYGEGRARMAAAPGSLILFGTGHGLAPAVLERADIVLEPIHGSDGYNHLSVRSAAAIILDRLLSHDRAG